MIFRLHTSELNNLINKGMPNIPLNIDFDFNNDILLVNNKKIKIVNNNEYTIKLQRTQIKAKDGAEGLKRFFEENNQETPLNYFCYATLLSCLQDVKGMK